MGRIVSMGAFTSKGGSFSNGGVFGNRWTDLTGDANKVGVTFDQGKSEEVLMVGTKTVSVSAKSRRLKTHFDLLV